MTIDLIASVALTVGATIMIVTLALGFGTTLHQRMRLAMILTTWFAVVVTIAATRVLYFESGPLAVPGFGLAVALPIILLVVVALRSAPLRARLDTIPLPLLIGVHAVRVEGVFFVLLYLQNRLPAPFAPTAGWGDIVVGLTALPVAWLVARGAALAKPIALVWNIAGSADLIAAVSLGVMSSPGQLRMIFGDVSSAIMPTLPWLLIPGFVVPLLFATHLAIFYRLRSEMLQIRAA